jgi:hypothetical protein
VTRALRTHGVVADLPLVVQADNARRFVILVEMIYRGRDVSRTIRIMTQKVQKILYSRSKHLEIAIVLVHIAYESQQKSVSLSQDFELHDDVGQT